MLSGNLHHSQHKLMHCSDRFTGASAYDVGSGIGARGGGTAEGADGDDEDYDWSAEGYYDDT